MLRQTREADLGLFARLANTGPLQGPGSRADAHFAPGLRDQRVENRISDRLHDFHSFLIIDTVIASVLMALGMMMVPRHHCSAL